MHVHTLDNLVLEAPEGKRLVVLGDPIGHSLSPAMHNAALRAMAADFPELRDWRYEAVHVPAEALSGALGLLHEAGVAGINLTIPHKVRVLEVLEEVDPVSRTMGAVNTLVRTPGGYRGTNTDGYGILQALRESFGGSLDGADLWLFGAGGAARGIIVACLGAGVRRLTVINRSRERLQELEADLHTQPLEGLGRVRFAGADAIPRDAGAQAIVVNATSLGLKASDPSPVEESFLGPGMTVYDTTYGTPNRLAETCRRAGAAYADGLSMLVWQGARSLEIWTGRPVPAAVMGEAAEQELRKRKQNG